MPRPSLYEFAGGEAALLRLAQAHHRLCLADPVLGHPFSHELKPDHVERLAAYWGEVLGGPPRYSRRYSGHSAMLAIHAGCDAEAGLGRRFVDCFVLAADKAGLPPYPAFRSALRAYMEWAVGEVLSISPRGSTVRPALAMPRWGWAGPEAGDQDQPV